VKRALMLGEFLHRNSELGIQTLTLRKMANGMKYIFAITWSVPRPTKHMTGNQIAAILEMISRAERARKTAMQTSQLPVMDGLVCRSLQKRH
jgi:hypothetical protein